MTVFCPTPSVQHANNFNSGCQRKASLTNIGFNGAETNCGIAHILGILLMNSSVQHSYIFSNYYNLQSVHFELKNFFCQYYTPEKLIEKEKLMFIRG